MKRFKSLYKMSLVLALSAAFLLTFQQQSQAAEKLRDDSITEAIEVELWTNDIVNMNSINTETQNGVVTFTGTVNNILARDRILKVAETIKGVRAIVNRMDVEPVTNMSDNELRIAVDNALLHNPTTDLYEVKTSVNDGVVTLTGDVQSWSEKEICSTVVKSVSGVKKVDNDISINYKMDRSDYEIMQEVESRMANDVQVDDKLINVSVNDGNVSLSGTVGSLSEKNRARADAWVGGVKSVSFDDLIIEWWARDEMRRNEMESRSDTEVEKAVKAAFLYDPRVLSFNPKVEAEFGTVTLTGIVDNLQAKQAAEQDALNTVGVWRVKNHLKVRPEVIPTNSELEERVEKKLRNNTYVEWSQISIDAVNGIVYLTGDVNTSFEKYQAEQATRSVKGVIDIINNINYEYEWTWSPDWEIRENVKEQLEWSSFVDESEINVSVDNGVVTLMGDTYDWSEYNAAERNAYEGGAKDVVNNLVVENQIYGPQYPYNYWGFPYNP